MPPRARQLAGLTLLAAGCLFAQQPGAPPEPEKFRARDSHQGVTIAAAPVADAAAAAAAFGKDVNPPATGVLAVEFLLVNDRKEPVRIALDRMVVESDERRYEQMEPERVALALYPMPQPKAAGRPGPRPIPQMPKDKNRAQRELAEAELRRAQLRAEILPPGGRARGFRYFDLRGQPMELSELRVYVPTVEALVTREALLFFEIELKPYAKP